jgi:hypothetical protein
MMGSEKRLYEGAQQYPESRELLKAAEHGIQNTCSILFELLKRGRRFLPRGLAGPYNQDHRI